MKTKGNKWNEANGEQCLEWMKNNPMCCTIEAGRHAGALQRWNQEANQLEIKLDIEGATWEIDDTHDDPMFKHFIPEIPVFDVGSIRDEIDVYWTPPIHATEPVLVWVDIDKEIVPVVKYLNSIPGVRTHASCQGTIGEGGPNPYRAQVMTSWPSQEVFEHFCALFDVESGCQESDTLANNWGYVKPKDGKPDFSDLQLSCKEVKL